MKVFTFITLLVSASAINLNQPIVLSHPFYFPDYPKVTMQEPHRVDHSNHVKGLILNNDKFTTYHYSAEELNDEITHAHRDNYRWNRADKFVEPK